MDVKTGKNEKVSVTWQPDKKISEKLSYLLNAWVESPLTQYRNKRILIRNYVL